MYITYTGLTVSAEEREKELSKEAEEKEDEIAQLFTTGSQFWGLEKEEVEGGGGKLE